MKKHLLGLCAAGALAASVAANADSFRLENGQLLEEGMTKAEVLDVAGKPKLKDSQGKSRGHGYKKEVWTFYTNNTFGAPFIVNVTFEGGTVTKVAARARTRP
jgi:outer membrane protein assembly factor BamE (lipoprotein component of BamABCDE complex)